MSRIVAVFVCTLLAVSACAAQPRGRALIVGVNDYADPGITDLRYSVADAKLLHSLLTDPARGLFPADQVRLLTDESPEGSKPDRATILEGLEWLSGAAEEEAVLFYFSGHGMVDDKGRQYLASRDVRMASLASTGVPVSLVNEILDDTAKTKARQVVVILDSCHSGVRRGARDAASESGQVMENLLSQGEGRVTLSSCAADEQSFEDPEKGHGVFTYYLAQGLRGQADANNDGLVGVGELHVYVRNEVVDWAKARGNRQTPRVQSNVSGEIVLAKDPAKFEAALRAKSEERARLTRLRDRL
ncbi:MAG: caspase family protein, partial [Armatimonadota bacterium]|nr:caspase family protein [Armatimonadota bacterium]